MDPVDLKPRKYLPTEDGSFRWPADGNRLGKSQARTLSGIEIGLAGAYPKNRGFKIPFEAWETKSSSHRFLVQPVHLLAAIYGPNLPLCRILADRTLYRLYLASLVRVNPLPGARILPLRKEMFRNVSCPPDPQILPVSRALVVQRND